MDDHGYGLVESKVDIRDYQAPTISTSLPISYSILTVGVKHQGSAPTCTAHVVSEIIEYHVNRNEGPYTKFSTDFIYGMREERGYKGEGMSIRDGLKVALHYGDVTHSLLPTNSNFARAKSLVNNKKELYLKEASGYKITGFYRIKTLQELKTALYSDGPVAAGIKYGKKRKLDRNNVYIYDPNDEYYNHRILIVGWTDRYLIRQNSWGRLWGNMGRFFIPIDDRFNGLLNEIYGVTDKEEHLLPPNDYIQKFGFIYNFIVNLFKR